MTEIRISSLDSESYASLTEQAQMHGRSVEAEACELLKEALAEHPHGNVASQIHSLFKDVDIDYGSEAGFFTSRSRR